MSTTLSEAAVTIAEELEGKKARKARKKAEKIQSRKARLAELRTKLAANDAKLAENLATYKEAAELTAASVDELIAAAFNPATPAKILAALKDSAHIGRYSRFDTVRLQAAYVQGLVRSAMVSRAAEVDENDKQRAVKIREAAEDAKLQAAVALGIVRKLAAKQSADDVKKLEQRGREAASRLAQAGKLFERFGWLRAMAETTNRELGSLVVNQLSPFAKYDGNAAGWIVVHPLRQRSKTDKAKRSGDKAALTPDEESKLRGLVGQFADCTLTEMQFRSALIAAGFKAKAKGRKANPGSGGDAADDADGNDPVDSPARGSGAPMEVCYEKLGHNATAEQCLQFVSAWFAENAAKNKGGAVAIAKATALAMTKLSAK